MFFDPVVQSLQVDCLHCGIECLLALGPAIGISSDKELGRQQLQAKHRGSGRLPEE